MSGGVKPGGRYIRFERKKQQQSPWQTLATEVRWPKGEALNILLDGLFGLSRCDSSSYRVDSRTLVDGERRVPSHNNMVPNEERCVCVFGTTSRVRVTTTQSRLIDRKHTVEPFRHLRFDCFNWSVLLLLLLLGYPTTTQHVNSTCCVGESGTQLMLTSLMGWVPEWYPSGVAA